MIWLKKVLIGFQSGKGKFNLMQKIEKALLDLIHNSGFPGIKFEKKIDFEKLYSEKFN